MIRPRKRVLFLTNNRLEHPRSKMYGEVITREHDLTVIEHIERSTPLKLINHLFFGRNFQIGCLRHSRKLSNYDVVVLQNTQMLPLAPIARALGVRVIFDSLDLTPYLNEYNLSRKHKVLKPLYMLQRIFYWWLEQAIVAAFCESALCNSAYLARRFSAKGHEALYASYLDGLLNDPTKPSALLYLGIFSREKGAYETLELARRLNAKLFVFGEVTVKDFSQKSAGLSVSCAERLNQEDLKSQLGTLLESYFLWGVSLLGDENFSYAVQEANKDIDYLAMGAPIIGNRRHETLRKIHAGAGLLSDSPELPTTFNSGVDKRNYASVARQIYARFYHQEIFAKRVLNAISPS